MQKKLIAQGAEAKIYLQDGNVFKERFAKSYRLKIIDERLRRSRTRRETKVLAKLQAINFPSPKLIKSNDIDSITIEKAKGILLKDALEKSDYKSMCKEIGRKIAILHNNSIIHGDLTTSNMILGDEVFFIDFGLSFFSDKAEDKAVDLHLLKEALESKHYRICDWCFKSAIDAYRKNAKNSGEILKRLESVNKRGRHRAKKGG